MKRYVRFLTVVLGLVLVFGVTAAPALACDYDCGCECRSPGYWKNHPCDWPTDSVWIGGVEYSKDCAIELMNEKGGDKSITMFRALVAAKLNVMNGCSDCCIRRTICRADHWMEYNPPGSGVKGSDCAWKYGECLYYKLDAYNNGYLWCCDSAD